MSTMDRSSNVGGRCHKIQRLKVEIKTDDRDLAQQLQDQFSQLCRGKLKQILDEQMSRFSGEGEVVRLEALEIDLGRFERYLDEHALLRELPGKLEQGLRHAVNNSLATVYRLNIKEAEASNVSSGRTGRQAGGSNLAGVRRGDGFIDRSDSHPPWAGFGEDFDSEDEFAWEALDHPEEYVDPDEIEAFFYEQMRRQQQASRRALPGRDWEILTGAGGSGATAVQYRPATDSDQQSLLYFLLTGRLPWYCDVSKEAEVRRLFGLLDSDDAAELMTLFKKHPAALARFAAQATPAEQSAIIDILAKSGIDVDAMRFVNACHRYVLEHCRSGRDAAALCSTTPFVQLAWHSFVDMSPFKPAARVGFVAIAQWWAALGDFNAWRSLLLDGVVPDDVQAFSGAAKTSSSSTGVGLSDRQAVAATPSGEHSKIGDVAICVQEGEQSESAGDKATRRGDKQLESGSYRTTGRVDEQAQFGADIVAGKGGNKSDADKGRAFETQQRPPAFGGASELSKVSFASYVEQLKNVEIADQPLPLSYEKPKVDRAELMTVPGCPDTQSDTIEIDNAGLFWLFSRLPEFFNQLGLLQDELFKELTSQQKAVHLIDYLVWGDGEDGRHFCCEQRLVLNKILCGMLLEDGVWSDCYLSDAERQACDQLLIELCGSVEKLDGTDIDTFRQSFIQRAGLISVRDGHWLLRIEPEGRDVLFQQQIEPLSNLCYPWMPLPLSIMWCERQYDSYQI